MTDLTPRPLPELLVEIIGLNSDSDLDRLGAEVAAAVAKGEYYEVFGFWKARVEDENGHGATVNNEIFESVDSVIDLIEDYTNWSPIYVIEKASKSTYAWDFFPPKQNLAIASVYVLLDLLIDGRPFHKRT